MGSADGRGGPAVFETRRVVVEALRLRRSGDDQWDEVAAFVGASAFTGSGPGVWLRRPQNGRPGFVEVDVAWQQMSTRRTAAQAGDWLVRLPSGRLTVMHDADFRSLFAPADDPETRASATSPQPAGAGR